MSIAAILVHVDVERDCEQRVQFALDLAARFEAALIGAAGLPLRPAFAAGGFVIYREPTQDDYAAMMLAGGRSVEGNRSKSGKYDKPAKTAKASGAKSTAKTSAKKASKTSKKRK